MLNPRNTTTDIETIELGNRLHEARAKLGLGYRPAAKIIGVNYRTLYLLETGRIKTKLHPTTKTCILAFIAEVDRGNYTL